MSQRKTACRIAYNLFAGSIFYINESSIGISYGCVSRLLIEMRYKADITAGALKIPESRLIADLLLQEADKDQWQEAIQERNILQAKNPATAARLTRLIRERLETMGPGLWELVRDGGGSVAAHAVFAAAVKHSALLGDFMDLVVREQFRLFQPSLTNKHWEDYLEGCRERDPEMPEWHDNTRERLRSSVFQMMAQAGYLNNSRDRRLQPVHVATPVLHYLHENNEQYVLRCIQVSL